MWSSSVALALTQHQRTFCAPTVLPYLKQPELDPQFRVFFSKSWAETFTLSLHNFLSTIFKSVPLPRILNFNVERLIRKSLENQILSLKQENDALRAALHATKSDLERAKVHPPGTFCLCSTKTEHMTLTLCMCFGLADSERMGDGDAPEHGVRKTICFGLFPRFDCAYYKAVLSFICSVVLRSKKYCCFSGGGGGGACDSVSKSMMLIPLLQLQQQPQHQLQQQQRSVDADARKPTTPPEQHKRSQLARQEGAGSSTHGAPQPSAQTVSQAGPPTRDPPPKVTPADRIRSFFSLDSKYGLCSLCF